MLKITWGY